MFTDAQPLIEKIEQVVRLIRSKGVGVYFVTQSPADVPDTVLGQLGNRVQHALRAFTRPRSEGGQDRCRNAAAESVDHTGDYGRVGEALVRCSTPRNQTVTERAWWRCGVADPGRSPTERRPFVSKPDDLRTTTGDRSRSAFGSSRGGRSTGRQEGAGQEGAPRPSAPRPNHRPAAFSLKQPPVPAWRHHDGLVSRRRRALRVRSLRLEPRDPRGARVDSGWVD